MESLESENAYSSMAAQGRVVGDGEMLAGRGDGENRRCMLLGDMVVNLVDSSLVEASRIILHEQIDMQVFAKL